MVRYSAGMRVAVAAVLSIATASCSKDTGVDASRVAALEKRLDRIEKFLEPFMNQPPPPAEPDPAAVYAVPIEGSPYRGVEHAAVTIVEAFEFA
jgi:hypothetical protein